MLPTAVLLCLLRYSVSFRFVFIDLSPAIHQRQIVEKEFYGFFELSTRGVSVYFLMFPLL